MYFPEWCATKAFNFEHFILHLSAMIDASVITSEVLLKDYILRLGTYLLAQIKTRI